MGISVSVFSARIVDAAVEVTPSLLYSHIHFLGVHSEEDLLNSTFEVCSVNIQNPRELYMHTTAAGCVIPIQKMHIWSSILVLL